MLITNTMFQHNPRHPYTWSSPDLETRNQIDFIIVSQKRRGCVKNVRTRPGADCNSDHQLLVADIKLGLRKMVQSLQPRRVDYQTLDNNYKVKISNRFEALLQCDEERTPNELWKEGQDIMLSVAEETICSKKKKISRWISDETLKEVEKRRHLRAKRIRGTVDEAAYKQQNSKIQRMIRKDKETFIQEQCQQIEENAINNSTKELYIKVSKTSPRNSTQPWITSRMKKA